MTIGRLGWFVGHAEMRPTYTEKHVVSQSRRAEDPFGRGVAWRGETRGRGGVILANILN